MTCEEGRLQLGARREAGRMKTEVRLVFARRFGRIAPGSDPLRFLRSREIFAGNPSP